MESNRFALEGLFSGRIEKLAYGTKSQETALRKEKITGRVFLGTLGLPGDEHEYTGHGGKDKALCLYPHDHYEYWKKIFAFDSDTAMFGENLSVIGLTEDRLCLGDIFSFGESLVQATEPRAPCHKLALEYGIPDLVVQMQKTGYTGCYLRVLKEGTVSADDPLVLEKSHPLKISMDYVNEVLYQEKKDTRKIRSILEVPELSSSLRQTLESRLCPAEG